MTAAAGDQKIFESWRELLDRHARITSALEHVLQDEHGLGVSEFEVLERLAAAEKDDHRSRDEAALPAQRRVLAETLA
jgi:hypothetical protein